MKKKLLTILLALFVIFGVNAQKVDRVDSKSKAETTFVKKSLITNGLRSGKTDFLSEPFDTEIPTTWTVETDAGATVTWAWDANGFANIDDDAAGNGVTVAGTLTSPTVDVSSETTVILAFDHYYRHYASSEGTIEVFDGTDWQNVVTYNASSGNMEHVEINVSTYINADFAVRFHYSDGGGWNWYWHLDNVVLYLPENHDLAVTNVTPQYVVNGESVTPQVTIHNYGLETEATYTVALTDGGSYNSSINVTTSIAFGEDLVIDMDSWTPALGTYTLTATVTVADDANNSNDVISAGCDVLELGYGDAGKVWAYQGYGGGITQTIDKTTGDITDIGIANAGGNLKCGDVINGTVYGFYGNNVFRILSNGVALKYTEIDGLNSIIGFAYDQINNQMYALNYTLTYKTELYTVDEDWNAVFVAELPTGVTYFGFAADGSGNLYTIVAADDSKFVSIDKIDAHTTEIGSLGGATPMQVRYSNDIGGDYGEANVIYATIYEYTSKGQAKFGTISTVTGEFTLITNTNKSHTMCAAIPKAPSKVTFTVTDGTNPVENATIFIKNGEYLTDAQGQAEIMLTSNDWPYTINATGFETYTGNVTVLDDDVDVDIVLTPGNAEWPVTFTVKDINNAAIEGATVILGFNPAVVTNNMGVALFNVENEEDIPYIVMKENYDDEIGLITVADAAVEKEVILSLTTYTVTFTVTDNHSSNVEGAEITIGDETKTSNADGEVNFTLIIGSYEFYVSANELVYTGETTFDIVDQDINVAVEMDADIYPASYLIATDNGNSGAYIEWTMQKPTELRHDDGIATNQLGFGSGTDNSVMGMVFNNNMLISGVKWFLTDDSDADNINVFIFGLKSDGTPDQDNLLYTVNGVTTIKENWVTFEFPSVINATDGFYVAISYAGFLGLATDDGIDEPYVAQPGTCYYAIDYSTGEWTDMYASFPLNFLLRPIGFDNGSVAKVTPKNMSNSAVQITVLSLDKPIVTETSIKSLQTLDLYFMSESDITNPVEWTSVATGIAFDIVNYTDTDNWPPAESGNYVYGIIANYDDGTSETTFSNVLSATVGVNNIIERNVNIFPNPSNGIINIYVNEELYDLEVIDITGRIVLKENLTKSSQLQINNKGLYLFRLTNINGVITEKKVIIK